MRLLKLHVVAAALLAAMTQAANATPDRNPDPPICPHRGTTIVPWGAAVETIVHMGPGDAPHICRVESGAPASSQLFQIFARSSTDDLKSNAQLRAREEAIVAGLSGLWPLSPGRTVTFSYNERGMEGTTSFRRETWSVVGPEDLADVLPHRPCGTSAEKVPSRCAIVVHRRQETLLGPSVPSGASWTYRFDQETRALLRIEPYILDGKIEDAPVIRVLASTAPRTVIVPAPPR
jgi:hypothetical protein